jgi:hypothetical protein
VAGNACRLGLNIPKAAPDDVRWPGHAFPI